MESIASKSLIELVRGREAVVRELEEREPVRMQELRLYDAAIAAFDRRSPDKPYAAIRQPKNVIPACLMRNKAWMTRAQILRDLEAGGYVIDNHETFPALLSDALRFHTRRGTLVRKDEAGNVITSGSYKPHSRFKNEMFGLPQWADDDTIRPLQEISAIK